MAKSNALASRQVQGSLRGPLSRLLFVGVLLGAAAIVTVSTEAAASQPTEITTSVVTTLHNFEFNAYFGEGTTQISCELDVRLTSPGTKAINEAYCMSYTTTLVHHVQLTPSGVVTTCAGAQCGSNAGDGTPDFSPHTKVRSGPFTCVVLARSVRCTVASGKGFLISRSAITKIGGA